MNIIVFLSTGFKDENEYTMEKHRHMAEVYVRSEYDYIRDEDNVIIEDNFRYKSTSFRSERENKLMTYSIALNRMSNCEVFVLLKEYDGSIKPGCMLEMNAWLMSGGAQPIIRQKIKY